MKDAERTKSIGERMESILPKQCTRHPREQWIDETPVNGRIRTHCGVCGTFIGYRPVK